MLEHLEVTTMNAILKVHLPEVSNPRPTPPLERPDSHSPRHRHISGRSLHDNSHRLSRTNRHVQIAAPMETRPFILEFNRLTQLFQLISISFSHDTNDRNLLNLFSSASQQFPLFLKYASMQLSSFANSTSYRASLKSSQLHQTGCLFLHSWTAFIEELNHFNGEDLCSFINQINLNFDAILESLTLLTNSLPLVRFRTNTACVSLQRFQADVILLRQEVDALFVPSKVDRFDRFDFQKFRQTIKEITHTISKLFDHVLVYCCLPLAKRIACRTKISASVAEIAEAVLMARQSQEMFNALKAQAEVVNVKLNGLFARLRFPFVLQIEDEGVQIVYRISPKSPAGKR
jgi:hypothetical protein